MRSRSVTVAVSIAVLSTGAAVGSHLRSQTYESEAKWLHERGAAEAEAYAATFDPDIVDQQLDTLEERHAVLDRVLAWHRLQLVFVLLSGVAAFWSAVLHLYQKLRTDLEDVTTDVVPAAVAVPPPNAPHGARA